MAALLIVEDEAIVALDLAAQIQDLGHKVLGIADNAEDAIRLAREKQPDLVLMDVVIKGPRDGVEAAQVIQRDLAIPVVFLTAYSDTLTVDRLTQVGPFGYLTKPFLGRDLKAAIQLASFKGQAEAHLREAHHWLTSALGSVTDGIIAIDPDGRVRFVNAAAEQIIGWLNDDAEGRPLSQVLQLKEALEPGSERTIATLVDRDGASRRIEVSRAPIANSAGPALGTMVMLRALGND